MIFDILKFNKNANWDIENNSNNLDVTLEEYLKDYSIYFKEQYIFPMGASIWLTPTQKMNKFPARTFLTFFKNHGLLGVNTHHQWLSVSNGSINYVNKIKNRISGKIFLNANIEMVTRTKNDVYLILQNGDRVRYDKVVFSLHAPDVLKILDSPSVDERDILSAFSYKENFAVLHNDNSILYPNKKAYAAWNYKTNAKSEDLVTLSYWINILQNLNSHNDYFVSLNETKTIKKVIEKITYSHPQFNQNAIEAQKKRKLINGKNNTYYAGAYWRYGFHEDGLYSANTIAKEFGCEL